MTFLALVLLSVLLFLVLGYLGKPGVGAVLAATLFLVGFWQICGTPPALWILTGLALLGTLVGSLPPLRRALITGRVMGLLAPSLPKISETELVALEAGTVWWDADLFSGNPDWKKLLAYQPKGLSAEEQAFLRGPAETICRMVDNEEVDRLGDLPPAVWAYLKDQGFMGLIIPKAFGGLEFSAEAISAIITKVASHNVTLAVTVMLPSSLGPAELLLHYGTQAQRDHFLPRLANGELVPAFALTEPHAGSDAGSIRSTGVIRKGLYEGQEVLGVELNWDKRYITLAPICNLLGLAFQALDPDGLLGGKPNLGISCALVPTHLDGVTTGERHDPLGVKFVNGPTQGKNVFIPLDMVIGGQQGLGKGWRMLMDCLSAGRAISLPGLACGAGQNTSLTVAAYSQLREQFGMPLHQFEGVATPMGRIVGQTWMMNAARELTAISVAHGEKPSVLSAIMKAYCTEGMRDVVNDGMDILAGAGICRGERNVLSRYFQAIPIGITVEGANILTRTLIIFGQGMLRCHRFAFDEVRAVQAGDAKAFDRAFAGHVGSGVTVGIRAGVQGLFGGPLAPMPGPASAAWLVRGLTRLSAGFALATEAAMASVGGDLKRREELSGRLADALAWMYFGSASLYRFAREGARNEDEVFLRWAGATALYEAQEALWGLLDNLPNRLVGWSVRHWIFPLGRCYERPRDQVTHGLARLLVTNEDMRQRLCPDAHIPDSDRPGLGALHAGAQHLAKVAPIRRKLAQAVRARTLPRGRELDLLAVALEKGVLSQAECLILREALERKDDLILVDSFSPEEYLDRCGS
ncbi:MAG: acyl-CoA dehydrogenase [Planctomycetes bacterium]|nr:acyl-CoA dehydrogenase [Planctomycetota bacterium]MCB9909750.1 acyl-CoA dehydrogenase [Planctomycetota bacterium]MCB9912341.1 acyl-CoA dehydrogenase [Planctomycetota bacterium]